MPTELEVSISKDFYQDQDYFLSSNDPILAVLQLPNWFQMHEE